MDNQQKTGNGRSMCVYITTPNENFIKQKMRKNKDKYFSTVLNEIIDLRRYNEEFNSCQDEF